MASARVIDGRAVAARVRAEVAGEVEAFVAEHGGRTPGLATILVGEALQATRDAGLRIVAVCPMVAGYVKKHQELDDVVDPVDSDVKRWLANR